MRGPGRNFWVQGGAKVGGRKRNLTGEAETAQR
jgi:hypothetical protein